MAITYRQLKIASGFVKILFCVLLFGSYFLFKEYRTNWTRSELRSGGISEGGKPWMSPADMIANGKDGMFPEAYKMRHLLKEDGNCTMRGISSFPTLFTNEQRLNGAIVINFLVAFYMCGMIGYCCSAYFVPSLEVICQDLGLTPDVAGATFMAAGSSAPEFFSAFIGTFISEDDTGLSAIVGSAAFNVFVILSFCCFLAVEDVNLTWWPLFRDCVVYVLSVLLLVVFMYDSVVEWWEGLILTSCYFFYILLMYFNPRLSAKAKEWTEYRRRKSQEADTTSLIGQEHHQDVTYGTSADSVTYQKESGFTTPNGGSSVLASTSSEGDNEDGIPRPFQPPKDLILRASWILGLPTIVVMFLTIPDCRKEKLKKWYMVTFFMATVWLMGTSYILYWMITVIGYTLDIPDTVMGISILAAGTSVPDLIASVLVVRHGYGDMAISNIIGSNIFEVFICLGLLWFIKSVAFTDVTISSDGLSFTSLALILTVIFIVLVIHFNGWKLNVRMGVLCIVVYICFITFAILRELGYIGGIEPPTYCPGPV